MMGIIAAIFLFGIVIFVHELGHFIMAKLAGIEVLRFSIGFGPRLFSFRRGRTEYVIGAIPFGGYVLLPDEEVLESEEFKTEEPIKSYDSYPWFVKIAVSVMGTVANNVFGFLVFFLLFAFIGKAVYLPVVGKVMEGSPAEQAGIKPGDVILKIDGQEIKWWSDISRAIAASQGNPIVVEVKRGQEVLKFTLKPKLIEEKGLKGEVVKRWIIGISVDERAVSYVTMGVGEALSYSWFIFKDIFYTMVEAIRSLPVKEHIKEISGPIGIGKMAADAAKSGFGTYVFLLGFISIAVGFFNLIPIPPLDGFYIILHFVEGLTRRKAGKMVKMAIQLVGIVIFVLLVVLTVYNDISRILRGEM